MSATISKFFSGAPKSAEELKRILNDTKSESEKYDIFFPIALNIYNLFKTDFEFEQNKDNYPTLFDEKSVATDDIELADDSKTQITVEHQKLYSQMYKEVLNTNMERWLDHYRAITHGVQILIPGNNTTDSPETKPKVAANDPFPAGKDIKESKGIRGRYYALEGVVREVEKRYNKSVVLYNKTLGLLINAQQKTNPYLTIFPKNDHLGELLDNNPTKSDLIILKCMITSAYHVFDINKDEKFSIEPQNMDGIDTKPLNKKQLHADTNIAKHQIIEYLLIAGVYLGAGTVAGTGAAAVSALISAFLGTMIGPAAIALTTATISGTSYAAYQKAFHNPNDKSFLELSKVNIRYLLSPEVLNLFKEKKVDVKKELEKADKEVERYFNDDGTRSFSKRVQAAYRAFKHGGKIKQKKTRKKKKN